MVSLNTDSMESIATARVERGARSRTGNKLDCVTPERLVCAQIVVLLSYYINK